MKCEALKPNYSVAFTAVVVKRYTDIGIKREHIFFSLSDFQGLCVFAKCIMSRINSGLLYTHLRNR